MILHKLLCVVPTTYHWDQGHDSWSALQVHGKEVFAGKVHYISTNGFCRDELHHESYDKSRKNMNMKIAQSNNHSISHTVILVPVS